MGKNDFFVKRNSGTKVAIYIREKIKRKHMTTQQTLRKEQMRACMRQED